MPMSDVELEADGSPLARLCLSQRRHLARMTTKFEEVARRERDTARELERARREIAELKSGRL